MNERDRKVVNEFTQAPRTNRDASAYEKYFGFTLESLRGQRILDVGAGDSTFAQQARVHGAHVVRVDPKYSENPPPRKDNAVCAVAQSLPFGKIFDITLASFSLYWVNTGLSDALLEMIRVTRGGGEVNIFPVMQVGSGNIDKVSKALSVVNISERSQALRIKVNPSYSPDKWNGIVKELLNVCDLHSYSNPDANQLIYPKKLGR